MQTRLRKVKTKRQPNQFKIDPRRTISKIKKTLKIRSVILRDCGKRKKHQKNLSRSMLIKKRRRKTHSKNSPMTNS